MKKNSNRTCFMSLVFLTVWKTHILIPVCFFAVFLCVEGAFWSASLLKVPGKGWFAILMAASEFSFFSFFFFWASFFCLRPRLGCPRARHGAQ